METIKRIMGAADWCLNGPFVNFVLIILFHLFWWIGVLYWSKSTVDVHFLHRLEYSE